jgi:hypothetical protein
MTAETEFIKAAHDRARDRAIEDSLLRELLESDEMNLAPYTRTLLDAAFERAHGWFHLIPGPKTAFSRRLYVGRLLLGLARRKLVRRHTDERRAWLLTDDGRHEARKLTGDACVAE